MLSFAFVFVFVGLVAANITGTKPTSGTCLCVAGTHVNAHTSAGTHTAVHASLNTGDCYKFHGGIHTTSGYTFYQLQNVHGENLWVAGNYLNTATSGHCTTTHSSGTTCSDAVAKDYACKILALHNAGKIHLWNKHPSGEHDNAYAFNNINDACHGQAASRSHYTCGECRNPGAPGGHVCLDRKLLQYIHDIGSSGYIHVNEIAGACHSCHSRHYNGKAVDLDNGRNSLFLSKCREYGGVEPLNEGNHIHCGFA
ncbi:uncharacterized protein LOC134699395 [Mytilus trossulus]|uniref:uncharacterized protein LOC134699395 n=1 Tax=Mytilus trossulus TaxID=6551 RepID=UPI003004724B